jgi:hypothetical protein
MSQAASPPEWVWEARLDPGLWRVLMALWSFSDFNSTGDQIVGPSRIVLGSRCGLKDPSGVRKHLAKLMACGLVEKADGTRFGARGLRLVWLPNKAGQVSSGTGIPERRDRCPGGTGIQRDRYPPQGGTGVHPGEGQVSRKGGTGVPPTLQDLPIDLPIDLAEEAEDFDCEIDGERSTLPADDVVKVDVVQPNFALAPSQPEAKLTILKPARSPRISDAQVPLLPIGTEPDRHPQPVPKRDLASEVIEYFNAQVAEIRVKLGKPKSRGISVNPDRRKGIQKCIKSLEPDEDPIAECRRVIDVQIAQVQSNTNDRERDWGHLDVDHLFTPQNFRKTRKRWREDGRHQLWWQEKPQAQGFARKVVNDSVGRNAAQAAYAAEAAATVDPETRRVAYGYYHGNAHDVPQEPPQEPDFPLDDFDFEELR